MRTGRLHCRLYSLSYYNKAQTKACGAAQAARPRNYLDKTTLKRLTQRRPNTVVCVSKCLLHHYFCVARFFPRLMM